MVVGNFWRFFLFYKYFPSVVGWICRCRRLTTFQFVEINVFPKGLTKEFNKEITSTEGSNIPKTDSFYRKLQRQRESFHPLVHSPDSHNNPGWARAQLRTWNSGPPTWVSRVQVLGPSSISFSVTFAGSWTRSKAGSQSHTLRGDTPITSDTFHWLHHNAGL